MLAPYRKFLVALAGVVLVGLNQFFNIELPYTPEGTVDVLITLADALLVYRVPNGPAQKVTS